MYIFLFQFLYLKSKAEMKVVICFFFFHLSYNFLRIRNFKLETLLNVLKMVDGDNLPNEVDEENRDPDTSNGKIIFHMHIHT